MSRRPEVGDHYVYEGALYKIVRFERERDSSYTYVVGKQLGQNLWQTVDMQDIQDHVYERSGSRASNVPVEETYSLIAFKRQNLAVLPHDHFQSPHYDPEKTLLKRQPLTGLYSPKRGLDGNEMLDGQEWLVEMPLILRNRTALVKVRYFDEYTGTICFDSEKREASGLHYYRVVNPIEKINRL